MHIEIHAPYGKVTEQQVNRIRKELMDLHHRSKRISRAQVYLKESPGPEPRLRSCAIDLVILGDSVFVHRNANSFEEAIPEALQAIIETAAIQLTREKHLAGKILSPVKA